MSDLFLLDGSNWMEFFNKNYCFVMFTKSDCEQCKILEKHIATTNFETPIPLAKLMLDRPGFAELKQSQPWISSSGVSVSGLGTLCPMPSGIQEKKKCICHRQLVRSPIATRLRNRSNTVVKPLSKTGVFSWFGAGQVKAPEAEGFG